MKKTRKNTTVDAPVDAPAMPKLRIVDAEELNTGDGSTRQRSSLVQQFMNMSDQIDAEIARILAL